MNVGDLINKRLWAGASGQTPDIRLHGGLAPNAISNTKRPAGESKPLFYISRLTWHGQAGDFLVDLSGR